MLMKLMHTPLILVGFNHGIIVRVALQMFLTTQLLSCRWVHAKALPGVNRLIQHLHNRGVPFALASNSKRKNIDAKISHQQGPFLFALKLFSSLDFLLVLHYGIVSIVMLRQGLLCRFRILLGAHKHGNGASVGVTGPLPSPITNRSTFVLLNG